MKNLEAAKSIFREGNKIKNYFSTYGSTIEEYRKIQKRDDCDKYHNMFNYDSRFQACQSHNVFFSSSRGYYGNSSCSKMLDIENPDVFWEGFDDYINKHKKEIFSHIAEHYMNKTKEMKKEIIQERDRMNNILTELE